MKFSNRALMIACLGPILSAACGQTSLGSGKPPLEDPEQGGRGPHGTAGSSASAPPQGTDTAGESGESGGAGGEAATPQDPRFIIIEPLPAPDPPPTGVQPGDALHAGTSAELGGFPYMSPYVSDDGTVVVGTSAYTFKRGVLQIVSGGQAFYWTMKDGTQPFSNTNPSRGFSPLCLSQDGQSVIAAPGDPSALGPGLLRWTPDGTEVAGTYYSSIACSSNGVLFGIHATGGDRVARWPTGTTILTTAASTGSESRMIASSADGSIALMSRYQNGHDLVLLDEALNETIVPRPEGRDGCDIGPASLSLDGSVVVAYCRAPGAGVNLYRWTAESGAVELFDGELGGFQMSGDASTIAGVLPDGKTLLYWTEASGLMLDDTMSEEVESFRVERVTETGAVLLIVVPSPQAAEMGLGELTRWIPSSGFARLGYLPTHDRSAIYGCAGNFERHCAVSVDGSVIVGGSSSDNESADAAIWDAQGVRSVASALEATGVDVQGMQLDWASHVWADSTVRVLGHGRLPNGDTRAFIAELPRRE